MAGCNWSGTTEVKLAENKPYCPDCASNCKRECTVCHKPYPNLKFYEKHSKRCNSCQSCYVVAKTKKASIENNHRKFGDTTGKRKQYDSDEESASSGEEKEEEGGGGGGGGRRRRRRRRRRRNMKLKVKALKKKIAQKMRSSVKLLRTFKKLLLLHVQKDN